MRCRAVFRVDDADGRNCPGHVGGRDEHLREERFFAARATLVRRPHVATAHLKNRKLVETAQREIAEQVRLGGLAGSG